MVGIDMVVYHIDMVILDNDMGYGLMIWEMTVSVCSSAISIWDILSLWFNLHGLTPAGRGAPLDERHEVETRPADRAWPLVPGLV
jgi:hypothetical protein